jgi:hypothetical protein
MTRHRHTTPPLVDPPTDPPQGTQPVPPQHNDTDRPDHPYHRLHHDTISQQPQRGETGYVAYARDLARAVSVVFDGARWHAEATSPAFPSREVDQHSQISITIDNRRHVALTQTNPAGGGPEQWTLTIDGQPIPHRVFPGEAPHHVTPVARSIWRHLNDVSVDPCDRLMCHEPATVATWRSSTCVAHAAASPAATRPAPSAAPSPPLPQPARSAPPPPRGRQQGMRR